MQSSNAIGAINSKSNVNGYLVKLGNLLFAWPYTWILGFYVENVEFRVTGTGILISFGQGFEAPTQPQAATQGIDTVYCQGSQKRRKSKTHDKEKGIQTRVSLNGMQPVTTASRARPIAISLIPAGIVAGIGGNEDGTLIPETEGPRAGVVCVEKLVRVRVV